MLGSPEFKLTLSAINSIAEDIEEVSFTPGLQQHVIDNTVKNYLMTKFYPSFALGIDVDFPSRDTVATFFNNVGEKIMELRFEETNKGKVYQVIVETVPENIRLHPDFENSDDLPQTLVDELKSQSLDINDLLNYTYICGVIRTKIGHFEEDVILDVKTNKENAEKLFKLNKIMMSPEQEENARKDGNIIGSEVQKAYNEIFTKLVDDFAGDTLNAVEPDTGLGGGNGFIFVNKKGNFYHFADDEFYDVLFVGSIVPNRTLAILAQDALMALPEPIDSSQYTIKRVNIESVLNGTVTEYTILEDE